MSNRQYITKAIVCGSRYSMTSDMSYLLFTQELGMLWATARSVRMEKSKQRCALQDFSIIRVSLVQGKSVWRIGSVEALSNSFLSSQSRISRGGVSFVIKTVRRYVHGEEMVPRAFVDAESMLHIMSVCTDTKQIEISQNIFELRLMDELGYIKNTGDIKIFLKEKDIQSAIKQYSTSFDKIVAKSIHHAAQVSHL